MKNHPLTPMTDANLVRVLAPQTLHRVGLIAYDVVANGEDAIRERIATLQVEGVRIPVVDAISNADLMAIGRAMRGMALVTAGSGVAIGLPQNWPHLAESAAQARADALPAVHGSRAVVSGSCSLATNAQVALFQAAGGPSFAIDPLRLAHGEDLVGQALAWVGPRLGDGTVLVYATAEPERVKQVQVQVQAQLGVAWAGEIVEQALSNIAVGLVERGVRQLLAFLA